MRKLNSQKVKLKIATVKTSFYIIQLANKINNLNIGLKNTHEILNSKINIKLVHLFGLNYPKIQAK